MTEEIDMQASVRIVRRIALAIALLTAVAFSFASVVTEDDEDIRLASGLRQRRGARTRTALWTFTTGPKPPAGFEKNWIPTVPGRNWFAYFRFYNPTEKYFDRSWPLPDFEQFSAGAISRAQQ